MIPEDHSYIHIFLFNLPIIYSFQPSFISLFHPDFLAMLVDLKNPIKNQIKKFIKLEVLFLMYTVRLFLAQLNTNDYRSI